MSAGDIVVNGVQHARRTAAVADAAHGASYRLRISRTALRAGERPLQRRTRPFSGRSTSIRWGPGCELRKVTTGLSKEHELQNDRPNVAQHRVGSLQERHLIGSLEKGHVVVFGGDPLVSGVISGSVSFGWKVMIQSHGLVLASSSISFIRWGAEHTLRVKVGG